MAKFIPETLHTLPNNIRRHVSKALRTLPDSFTVRLPVLEGVWPADLVIQGPDYSWLNLLFLTDVDEFKGRREEITSKFNAIADQCHGATGEQLEVQFLVVVWQAKSEKAIPINSGCSRFRLVGQHHFRENYETLIRDSCCQTTEKNFSWLLHTVLPEREVPAACTTRTMHHRDNSTQLKHFFLDYDQELAAKLDLFVPEVENSDEQAVRLINGVAGSGKTLIIVSRILMYCAKYPDRKVLLLIHNKPVTADIEHRIRMHWGGVPDNLEIKTFWKWCRSQWVSAFKHNRIKLLWNGDQKVKNFVAEERPSYNVERLTDTQLYDEIEFINDHMIFDEEAYLDASRTGRGFALRHEERRKVWQLQTHVNTHFGETTGLLSSLMPKQLSNDTFYDSTRLNTYDHIIVDEAQFFAPSWFEVVKRSLTESGSLFMCADPNQGFLKSRLSWKSAGINVRGRTKVLRKSYRTTQQILHAANRFLTDILPQSGEDYIQPIYDGMTQGQLPVLFYKDAPQDCLDQLVNETEALINQGVPVSQIMVLYTTGVFPSKIQKRLEPVVGKDNIWNFSGKDGEQVPDDSKSGFLKIAKVEAATGLEAGVVFVIGVEQVFSSYENLDLTEEERDEKQQEAARKMYMAMTRAGQRLVMFATASVSKALEGAVEVNGKSVI